MDSVTILIPSTGRRPELLTRTIDAFLEQGFEDILTVYGLSWGAGLNRLAQHAKGDYWLTCCDDTLPVLGWFEPARGMVDAGHMPASRYLNPDGTGLHPMDEQEHGAPVTWCRSFLLTPAIYAEVGSFIDATWYADIDYSERLAASGRPIVACDGYSFTHLGGERDWLTREEEARSAELYQLSHRDRGAA